jgi:hypothetical protein
MMEADEETDVDLNCSVNDRGQNFVGEFWAICGYPKQIPDIRRLRRLVLPLVGKVAHKKGL